MDSISTYTWISNREAGLMLTPYSFCKYWATFILFSCLTVWTALWKPGSVARGFSWANWSKWTIQSSPMCYNKTASKVRYNYKFQAQNIKYLGDNICESRVTQQQPAAGGDSISFVLELFRVHLVEVTETKEKLALKKRKSIIGFQLTYRSRFKISEWICATPLTAWEPTMAR